MDGHTGGCVHGWQEISPILPHSSILPHPLSLSLSLSLSVDGWRYGWVDRRLAGCMDGWMGGWVDGWMHMGGWMDGWMDLTVDGGVDKI